VTDHRELADESDVEVSFADPDEAVHERVRDLGLSPAARDIDETVRASKVVDSKVADTIEERVAEIVAEADPGAFDSAPDREDTATEDGANGEAVPDEAETAGGDHDGDGQVTMEDYL